MNKKTSLLFGAHMSIQGGFYHAIERGELIGCTAIQIFTKSNRQWRDKPIKQEEADLFKTTWKKSSIRSITVHASYLINIASPNPETEQKSLEALKVELERCATLGISHLVLHPGSHSKSDQEEALKRIARNIDHAFAHTPANTMILLETMAGQGSIMCSSFEEIATIIKHSRHPERIGVCLDTCHVFAAGYNISTKEDYNAMWSHFDKTIGINKLKAIHINGSKTECGSRVDRHSNLDQGKIGLEAFALLFNDQRFDHVPKILETPYETLEDYVPNMNIIYSLIK